jgi:hypothetical protein
VDVEQRELGQRPDSDAAPVGVGGGGVRVPADGLDEVVEGGRVTHLLHGQRVRISPAIVTAKAASLAR